MAQDHPQDAQDTTVATVVVDKVAKVVAATIDVVGKAAEVVEEDIVKTTEAVAANVVDEG
ncbi:hypothetical protein Dimus_030531, partial [Dionaea muscipula]